MKLTTLLEIKGIDPLPLQNFKPHGGVILMDDNEREVTLQWIRQCNLGFELLPLFSNQESDCVAIYTSGFLKGKVAIVRHDEAVFAPQFKRKKIILLQRKIRQNPLCYKSVGSI